MFSPLLDRLESIRGPGEVKEITAVEVVEQLPAVDVSWQAHKVLLAAIFVQGSLEGKSYHSINSM